MSKSLLAAPKAASSPATHGSLALASQGSKKQCCEAQTLVLCTAAQSPPGHRVENSQGWCFIRIYKNMKKAMISLLPSSPCIIPSLLSVRFIHLERGEEKTPSYGHDFLFLCSITCIRRPSSLGTSLMQFFATQRWAVKLPATAAQRCPAPRKGHAGLQMKGTLINPVNFQFSPKANLAVLSPTVRNDNEAIDRKQVQRGAARRTASLRTPLPRSASES